MLQGLFYKRIKLIPQQGLYVNILRWKAKKFEELWNSFLTVSKLMRYDTSGVFVTGQYGHAFHMTIKSAEKEFSLHIVRSLSMNTIYKIDLYEFPRDVITFELLLNKSGKDCNKMIKHVISQL